MSDKKVIGILGGMGPLATADLFQKITLHTAASCDQDHPRVCIDSNTNISDRTAALLHGGADPVPEMVKSAQRLESIGADLLIMPCNTAHNFYDAVASSVSIPVLHMIAITRDALKSRGVKCAGLLATDGTVQTGIYQRTFEGSGVELLTPDNTEDQSAVMDIIYNGVKAGDLTHDATAFRAACEHLLARGAEVLILGCTELPPAFDIYHLDYPNVDRPHGQKIWPCQPLRSAKGVSHPHPAPHVPQKRGGRAPLDLAEKVQQRPRPLLPHLGCLGG